MVSRRRISLRSVFAFESRCSISSGRETQWQNSGLVRPKLMSERFNFNSLESKTAARGVGDPEAVREAQNHSLLGSVK